MSEWASKTIEEVEAERDKAIETGKRLVAGYRENNLKLQDENRALARQLNDVTHQLVRIKKQNKLCSECGGKL